MLDDRGRQAEDKNLSSPKDKVPPCVQSDVHQSDSITTDEMAQKTVQPVITPLSDHDSHQEANDILTNDPNLYEVRACVHELIEDKTKAQPNASALESSIDHFTYVELSRASDALAERLIRAGVHHGNKVASVFEKSSWAPIAMLAVMKAGAVYVPLDPGHPKQRLAAVVQKARVLVAVVSKANKSVLKGLVPQTVVADDDDSAINEGLLLASSETPGGVPSQERTSPDDAAVVVFTSGSTGTPKGVVLSHSAICSSAHHHGPAMSLSSKSRVLQYATYTFDISVYDICTTLISGGTVCTPSDDQRLNGLVEVINSLRVDWACLVPSLLTTFEPEDIPLVKTLALAAEMAPQAVIDKWAERVHLVNCYGSTEASTCIPGRFVRESRPGFVGTPRGVIPFVVDENDYRKIVPCGQPGELVVVGPVLSSGYLEEPGKSMAAFPTDFPALRSVTSRAYRTGDIVEQSPLGELKYLGRKDSLVKVRGQRVELGEIEYHVRAHPKVAACAILFPREGIHVDEIVAIVQIFVARQSSQASGSIDELELRDEFPERARIIEFLQCNVPSYMLPSQWYCVSALPMTSSGKTDRNMLLQSLNMKQQFSKDIQRSSANAVKLQDTSKLRERIRELLLPSYQDTSLESLETHPLGECGFDSIRLMALARNIKISYGHHFDIRKLAKESIASLEALVRSTTLRAPVCAKNLSTELEQLIDTTLKVEEQTIDNGDHAVFLTGAAGLVGIHILHTILRLTSKATRVIALVRAPNAMTAHYRILQALDNHNLVVTAYDLMRIEVWQGDLGSVRFDLTGAQWRRLNGSKVALLDDQTTTRSPPRIDTIIHCGAAVDYAGDYDSLRKPNVDSTLQLLRCGLRSKSRKAEHRPLKFVYVSGGRTLEFALQRKPPVKGIDDHKSDKKITEPASAMLALGDASTVPLTGYDSTKLLSDALVLSAAESSGECIRSVLRPGYVIGASHSGRTNSKDFIWRVVAAAVRLRRRCSEGSDAWLFMSDAQEVAETIWNCVVRSKDGLSTASRRFGVIEHNMTQGVLVNQFWLLISTELNVDLEPVESDQWLHLLDEDVASQGIEHPMFPFLHIHTFEQGKIGMAGAPSSAGTQESHVELAIRKNVQYLSGIGLFTQS